MGTYLSTPVTDKGQESGESLHCPATPLAWGVVDMQGWRKTMEDSHVAQTDIDVPAHHFHDHHTPETVDAKVFGVFDGHGGPEVARFCQLYLVSVLTQQETWIAESENENQHKDAAQTDIGQALIEAFHALDRMIDDPERRDELVRLRAIKPAPGERKNADKIPPKKSVQPVPPTQQQRQLDQSSNVSEDSKSDDLQEEYKDCRDTEHELEYEAEDEGSPERHNPTDCEQDASPEGAMNMNESDSEEEKSLDRDDEDSNDVVGKDEAAELDQDLLDDDKMVEEIDSVDPPSKVSAMFQRLLNMSGQSGQVVVSQVESEQVVVTQSEASPPETPRAVANSGIRVPSSSLPSIVQNGRLICNLPDHAIHAGATAIVAVIVGRTLTVANAGDSRGVLSRNGNSLPLSFDHKPTDEEEMDRINQAGGFVNQFGRVNGNLNLSRSIGDLKYKQVPGIAPKDQMITAQPDIVQVRLEPEDEFIILGCDGIWDCLSNDKAVEYVRTRIDSKTPTEIGIEMLNEIISDDPRATQGIGGDNMTAMVVDLQPQSRSYRVADASPKL